MSGTLLIELVLFSWLLVQASFVQRLVPNTSFLFTSLAAGCVVFVPALLLRTAGLDMHGWAVLLSQLGALMLVMDLFRMRSALERHYNSDEPYGLSMQGVPLFLLGPFYLQYHLRQIALWKDKQSKLPIQ